MDTKSSYKPVVPIAESAIAPLETPAQATLARAIAQTGIGLHSGATTEVVLKPAPVNTGRVFVRTDLSDRPTVSGQVTSVQQTLLSTELGQGTATVRTVEHLLAALVALGVDNVWIEASGPEIPLMDGSALPWVEAIQAAGVIQQDAPRPSIQVSEPISVQAGDAFVIAMPAPVLRYTYGIDFDLSAIGNQWFSWDPQITDFATAIAPARTFGLAHQIAALQSQGLIKGGSLDNALVCDRDGWINPPLRFDNEPVRHKLLDLIGDLSLLGTLPQAHILAYKASHALHVQLARAIAATALERQD